MKIDRGLEMLLEIGGNQTWQMLNEEPAAHPKWNREPAPAANLFWSNLYTCLYSWSYGKNMLTTAFRIGVKKNPQICGSFSFLMLQFFYFILLKYSWSECCVKFCYTAKWLSYAYTHTHTFFFMFFSTVVYHRILNILPVGACCLSILYIIVGTC